MAKDIPYGKRHEVIDQIGSHKALRGVTVGIEAMVKARGLLSVKYPHIVFFTSRS